MPRRLALFALVIATLVIATVSASSVRARPGVGDRGGGAVFSTTTSVAGAGEAELCFGQVPTIVGVEEAETVVGTDGPDVVIAHGGEISTRGWRRSGVRDRGARGWAAPGHADLRRQRQRSRGQLPIRVRLRDLSG